jgi:hypothetical protein
MLPIAVFSGLLAVMLVVIVVHQYRDARPRSRSQGRHVAVPPMSEAQLARIRRMPKHAA